MYVQPLRPLSLAIALIVAAPLPAQTTSEEDDAARLDTVQVTARRRAEGLQDVPMSVSAFDAEQLRSFRRAISRACKAPSRTSTSSRVGPRPRASTSSFAAWASRMLCRPSTPRSGFTWMTSISRASKAPCSASSTSSGSRCCAGRRARSMAATPPAARSS